MIEKPILSPDFSVEDIRKLRTYTAEVTKNMIREERRAYMNDHINIDYMEIAKKSSNNKTNL